MDTTASTSSNSNVSLLVDLWEGRIEGLSVVVVKGTRRSVVLLDD
jgi:hypothetical protein